MLVNPIIVPPFSAVNYQTELVTAIFVLICDSYEMSTSFGSTVYDFLWAQERIDIQGFPMVTTIKTYMPDTLIIISLKYWKRTI